MLRDDMEMNQISEMNVFVCLWRNGCEFKHWKKNETFLFPSSEDHRGMEQHSPMVSHKQDRVKRGVENRKKKQELDKPDRLSWGKNRRLVFVCRWLEMRGLRTYASVNVQTCRAKWGWLRLQEDDLYEATQCAQEQLCVCVRVCVGGTGVVLRTTSFLNHWYFQSESTYTPRGSVYFTDCSSAWVMFCDFPFRNTFFFYGKSGLFNLWSSRSEIMRCLTGFQTVQQMSLLCLFYIPCGMWILVLVSEKFPKAVKSLCSHPICQRQVMQLFINLNSAETDGETPEGLQALYSACTRFPPRPQLTKGEWIRCEEQINAGFQLTGS